jgi:VTC domain
MNNPLAYDRIEKKYQVGISEGEVAGFWRDLSSFLAHYGLAPVQEITSVGSVYFDNKDFDLLRYSLFGHLMLLRVRTYEMYGRPPEPIAEYWVEVKTAADERRKKRRFPLTKCALLKFFEGRDLGENGFDYSRQNFDPDVGRDLYRETQETLFTLGLKPVLMVLYKRVAFQSEAERLSIDWDVQYHHVTTDVFDYDSWKYLVEQPAGKANRVILEMKYLRGDLPTWFSELQRMYPIWKREYLKPIEGMGFLFQGSLRYDKQANFFLPLIESYLAGSRTLG